MQAEQSLSGRLISKSILILTFNTLGVPVFVFLWLEANSFARKCLKKNKMPSFFKADLNGRFGPHILFNTWCQILNVVTEKQIYEFTLWPGGFRNKQ